MMPVVGLPVAGALMISKSPSLMSEITAPLTTPFQQASSVSGSLLTWLVTGKMPVQNMPTINLAMGQSTRSNMNIPVNINFGTPAMIGGNKIFLVKPIGH